jgi:hypothetical protein
MPLFTSALLSPPYRAGTGTAFAGVRYAASAYCKGRITVLPCLGCCPHSHVIYLPTTHAHTQTECKPPLHSGFHPYQSPGAPSNSRVSYRAWLLIDISRIVNRNGKGDSPKAIRSDGHVRRGAISTSLPSTHQSTVRHILNCCCLLRSFIHSLLSLGCTAHTSLLPSSNIHKLSPQPYLPQDF